MFSEEHISRVVKSKGLYKRLLQSLLPQIDSESFGNANHMVSELHNSLKQATYYPNPPRGYIFHQKKWAVPRIVPVFTLRDNCMYYLAVLDLESTIAGNRVAGTYGGWTMSNPKRAEEDEEFNTVMAEIEQPDVSTLNTINPVAFLESWKGFQQKAYAYSRNPNHGVFVQIDISNFYDSINLDLLERQLRQSTSGDMMKSVDLLFLILRNWNRRIEGYAPKTVGLPMEEIGDGSRLLANFYLNPYDKSMRDACAATTFPSHYLRFADDQILMAHDEDTAQKLVFEAARQLHKLGLNINSSKVKVFPDLDSFDLHWCFDLHRKLSFDLDGDAINAAASAFVDQLESSQVENTMSNWKWYSVLRRIVTIGLQRLDEDSKTYLTAFILQEDMMHLLYDHHYSKLHSALDERNRRILLNLLNGICRKTPVMATHLYAYKFFCKHYANVDHSWLRDHILRHSNVPELDI